MERNVSSFFFTFFFFLFFKVRRREKNFEKECNAKNKFLNRARVYAYNNNNRRVYIRIS